MHDLVSVRTDSMLFKLYKRGLKTHNRISGRATYKLQERKEIILSEKEF